MNNSDSTSVLVIEPLSTIPPVVGKITSLESLREHLQWAIELGSSIGAMYTLKAQAQALMQLPTEDGFATAGPTFEYVAKDHPK